MAFWTEVALAYLALLGLGLVIGRALARRRRDDGRGRGHDGPVPVPPAGPSFALDCPPLGSAFDRELLPGAFAEEPISLPA